MPEPNSPHINSTPAQDGQPYDATLPDGDRCGRWEKVRSGYADLGSGRPTGEDWPSSDRWQQT